MRRSGGERERRERVGENNKWGRQEVRSEREREIMGIKEERGGVFNGNVGFSVAVWSGQACDISF
jgi:hypothetical protein